MRPLSGEPRARVRCRPVYEYGLDEVASWRASNHIEYTGFPTPVRLTTNVPLTYVEDERPFLLEQRPTPRPDLGRAARGGPRGDRRALPRADARLLAPLGEGDARTARLPARGDPLGARAQAPPVRGHGRAPRRDDDEPPGVPGLRAHVGLPLLLAPRCVLHAATRSSDSATPRRWSCFLEYLRNVGRAARRRPAARRTGSTGTRRPRSASSTHLSGFNGDGPVRIGNQAFEHVQNDVYGEMVLAVSRLFLDTRFVGEIPPRDAVEIVRGLLDQIEARLEEPDAGLWEFRGDARLHSFSVLMHWAGARRAVEVGGGARSGRSSPSARRVERARRELLETRCWNEEIGALTQVAGEPQLDACAPARRPSRLSSRPTTRAPTSHVDAIRTRSRVDGGLLRSATARRTTSARPSRIHRVHVLARRGARADRQDGRGAGALRPAARPSTTGSGSTARTSSRTRSSRAATSPRRTATSG